MPLQLHCNTLPAPRDPGSSSTMPSSAEHLGKLPMHGARQCRDTSPCSPLAKAAQRTESLGNVHLLVLHQMKTELIIMPSKFSCHVSVKVALLKMSAKDTTSQVRIIRFFSSVTYSTTWMGLTSDKTLKYSS